MAVVVHAPPGRAGRLWLQRRISIATSGAELLDHKLRALRAERQRLALRSERTRAAWEAASREADTWLVRAALIGGERSIRLAAEPGDAAVDIVWQHSMGVRFPNEARCTLPPPDPDAAPPGAAVVLARESHRRALETAVEQAVVEAAIRAVEANLAATRRRLRAIEHRWIPRLQESLSRLQSQLDEEEHADGVRRRWAAGRPTEITRDSSEEGQQ